MSFLYDKIMQHAGHHIEAVYYGDEAINAAIECEDCNAVIIDEDKEGADDHDGI